MPESTKIRWTDATWNPVTGCSKVSPGCAHCYAETLSLHRGWSKKPWTPANAAENVVLHPERLGQPLHWKKPRRVFVNSMSDVFHELVPDEFVDRMFAVMARTPQHTYQLLTKRPERMLAYLADDRRRGAVEGAAGLPRLPEWPLPNVWLGTSTENQHWADVRIPLLLHTPASVRFISAEPLLGPIDLDRYLAPPDSATDEATGAPTLDWVIAGGESGPGFRPMHEDWARTLRDQCVAAGVAFFFKQSAAFRPEMGVELDGRRWEQWPE